MKRVLGIALLAIALMVPSVAWADACPAGGEHDYEAELVYQAADDADGLRRYTCVKCGDSYEQAIPATGHDWGPWEVVVQPSVGAEGLERRVCSHDSSHVEERVVPALAAPEPEPDGAEPVAAPEPEPSPEPLAAEPAPEVEPVASGEAGPEPEPAAPEPQEEPPAPEPDPWAPNAMDAALIGFDAAAIAVFAAAAGPLFHARRWAAAQRRAARDSACLLNDDGRGGRVL